MLKMCSQCKEEKPSTTEYFFRDKRAKDGLQSSCKKCERIRVKKWQAKHPEKCREYTRQWEEKNAVKKRSLQRQRYAENAEEERHRKRQWRIENPEKRRAQERKYRSRKNNKPAFFSAEHEKKAIEYFNGRCAICGRQLRDLFGEHTMAMDHWIPLSSPDCPGTIPTNMVPLCHGVDGCNNRKSNRDPEEWLIAEFGKRKAKKILERIETYFKSLGGEA